MQRPRLLISVRTADEAAAALAGGADWIDLKEPDRGPLGAVDAEAARDIVALVAGRAPVSAAAGELIDWPTGAGPALSTTPGIEFVKLGLARCREIDWRTRWRAVERELAATGVSLVAVIYADAELAAAPPTDEVAELAAAAACRWTLIDTFCKTSGRLGDHLPPARLAALLESLRRAGRRTVVAGSLDRQSLAALPLDRVDMAAMRGAACEGGRRGAVCRRRVAELRAVLEHAALAAGGPDATFSARKEFA